MTRTRMRMYFILFYLLLHFNFIYIKLFITFSVSHWTDVFIVKMV